MIGHRLIVGLQKRANLLHFRVGFGGTFRLEGLRAHGQSGETSHARDDCFFSGHVRILGGFAVATTRLFRQATIPSGSGSSLRFVFDRSTVV